MKRLARSTPLRRVIRVGSLVTSVRKKLRAGPAATKERRSGRIAYRANKAKIKQAAKRRRLHMTAKQKLELRLKSVMRNAAKTGKSPAKAVAEYKRTVNVDKEQIKRHRKAETDRIKKSSAQTIARVKENGKQQLLNAKTAAARTTIRQNIKRQLDKLRAQRDLLLAKK